MIRENQSDRVDGCLPFQQSLCAIRTLRHILIILADEGLLPARRILDGDGCSDSVPINGAAPATCELVRNPRSPGAETAPSAAQTLRGGTVGSVSRQLLRPLYLLVNSRFSYVIADGGTPSISGRYGDLEPHRGGKLQVEKINIDNHRPVL